MRSLLSSKFCSDTLLVEILLFDDECATIEWSLFKCFKVWILFEAHCESFEFLGSIYVDNR